MYSTIKILIILLSIVILNSCRSSKPTTTFHTVNDTLTFSADSSFFQCQDSLIKTEDVWSNVCGVVEFVEAGGSISVVADGSLVMSGVATLHSSRLMTSSVKEESDRSIRQTQKKDSLADVYKEETLEEPKSKEASLKDRMRKAAIMAFIILTIIIIGIRRMKSYQSAF